MAGAKNQRIYLRASPEQSTLIRHAAHVQRKSVSEFVLDSACRSAESALYDLKTIRLDERSWKQFQAALKQEGKEIPELAELFGDKTPWD